MTETETILWSDLPVGGVAVEEQDPDFPFLIRLARGYIWLRDEWDHDFMWSDGSDFYFDEDTTPKVRVIATGMRSEWEARAAISEYRERRAWVRTLGA